MKEKPDPARDAEDKLMKRGSPKSRELLKTSRQLKREHDRREWMKENRP